MEEDSMIYWICCTFFSLKKNQTTQDRDHNEYHRGSPAPEKDGNFTEGLI